MVRAWFVAFLCLCAFLCVDAARRRRRRRRRRRWGKKVGKAFSDAGKAIGDTAVDAGNAIGDAAGDAWDAAQKFANEAFGGLMECISDIKECIMALINAPFKGLGLPQPIDNPSGNKYCLRPQGLCITLPSPSLTKAPWQWGASLHCVDIVMMISYWMDFGMVIFNAIMGALGWFLDKLCAGASVIIDFITQCFQMVAKVFEPLLAPVMNLFKPLVDAMNRVADAIGGWFDKVFGFLDISKFLEIPSIAFPSWSFMNAGCMRIDSFTFELDGCGIKEIYDSLRAAFCSLVELNFDKFIKSIKEGIKAVVDFGKNLSGCFVIRTVGLEAVVDAFPFVKTVQEHKCSGAYIAGALASIMWLISAAGQAIKTAFGWMIDAMSWLKGATARAKRSNRSGGNKSNVVGIKSAVDVQFSSASGPQEPCWKEVADDTPWKTIDKWEAGRKNTGYTPISWLHHFTIALNYGFMYIAKLRLIPGVKIVCFLVLKMVLVITEEAKVGTFVDLQFAVFYGSVVALPLLSVAMDTLKKISPWKAQFPALGISWTTDCTGAAKYGTQKYHADAPKVPSNRGRANAVFLQAMSLNPKIELGWPAYAGVMWGLTVPVEFKPIWLMWCWSMDLMTIDWKFGTQPLTDFQLEYDLIVYLPDTDKLTGESLQLDPPCGSSADPFDGVGKDKKGAGWADEGIVSASAARGMSAASAAAQRKVKQYITVYVQGSAKLFISVIQMFNKGPWGLLAEICARVSFAVMFWGWVFAICASC